MQLLIVAPRLAFDMVQVFFDPGLNSLASTLNYLKIDKAFRETETALQIQLPTIIILSFLGLLSLNLISSLTIYDYRHVTL